MQFVPMVAEPSGGWGPSGLAVLRRLAQASESRRGMKRGTQLQMWLRRLSVSIRQANAKAVLRRMPEDAMARPTELA